MREFYLYNVYKKRMIFNIGILILIDFCINIVNIWFVERFIEFMSVSYNVIILNGNGLSFHLFHRIISLVSD